MNLTLHVWRQAGPTPRAALEEYEANDISPDMSFLEMLDVVNEQLIEQGDDADRVRSRLPRGDLRLVRRDDQRRGARPVARRRRPASCTCAASRTATRSSIEPWRARAFPVIKDLCVNRGALDRIIAAGGYISAPHGRRAGRERDPGAEGRRRRGDGCRGVHRLRRVRGGVPERLGLAVHRRRRSRTSACCRRASPSATAAR